MTTITYSFFKGSSCRSDKDFNVEIYKTLTPWRLNLFPAMKRKIHLYFCFKLDAKLKEFLSSNGVKVVLVVLRYQKSNLM